MILLINQHKGEWSELIANITDFVENSDPKYFTMVLTIDQPVTNDQQIEFKKLFDKHTNVIATISDKTQGLSISRVTSLKLAVQLGLEFSHVLFWCTNSKLNHRLDKDIHDLIITESSNIILIPCKYEGDKIFDRVPFHRNRITISEYLSNTYKEDYTLCFTRDSLSKVILYPHNEPYYPEDLLIMKIAIKSGCDLTILPIELQISWYNPKGMSMNFNRKFQLDNRRGFHERAEYALSNFMNGKLILSMDVLKTYAYDYVTLGVPNLKQFDGTPILPVLQWALMKWTLDKDHDNMIAFIDENDHQ